MLCTRLPIPCYHKLDSNDEQPQITKDFAGHQTRSGSITQVSRSIGLSLLIPLAKVTGRRRA